MSGTALQFDVAPSVNFDLTNWRLTLPIDSAGLFLGTAVEVQNLAGYLQPKYFYTGPDGAMVFNAPVDGTTSSGSHYARSELREMNGTVRAAWRLDQGGYMSATLEVDKIPTLTDGTQGKLVIGQIHGQTDELVRLYWDKGSIYFVNDHAGVDDKETKFVLLDASGNTPDVSIDEKFSYSIEAQQDTLVVKVYSDGHVYSSTTQINNIWDVDTLYFKAGAYLGVNETQGVGEGQTSFYALNFNHTGATPIPEIPAAPTPPPVVAIDMSNWPADLNNPAAGAGRIIGTSGIDKMMGTSGADIFVGSAGGDTITGGAGFDIVSYETSARGVSVDLDKLIQSSQKGDASLDQLTSVEGLWGSHYADRLYGNISDNVLAGGQGGDYLDGDKGADVLIGGAGDDTLKGNSGADRFVFDAGGGHDTILDFKAGEDTLVFVGLAGASSVSEVLAHATMSGASLVLTFGADSITLLGANVNSLTDHLLFA